MAQAPAREADDTWAVPRLGEDKDWAEVSDLHDVSYGV